MKQVLVAKYAGFCPGVKRAWILVTKSLQTNGKNKNRTYILGELIHNKQALDYLTQKGLVTIDNLRRLSKPENNGTLFIRAHGEPPQTYREIKKRGLKFIDATCPCVTKVQKTAKNLEKEGFFVIICGEKDHPEALATVGYTKTGIIISSLEEAKKLPAKEKIAVISQTTFSESLFNQICRWLEKKCKVFYSVGTICEFTRLAQAEARKLAGNSDIVVVIGGKQSSNTKRLVEVSSKIAPTHHIETAGELKKCWFKKANKVAVLAGASTPGWIIEQVADRIEGING